MAFTDQYAEKEPSREEVDASTGPLLLEFGSPGCGFCQAAQPLLEEAMAAHSAVRHLKIGDGRGRRLGRSFGVKLWPTLVFLRDGEEQARLVRPQEAAAIEEALRQLDA